MANLTPVRKKAAQAHRGLRIARMMAKALVSTRHPILVHLVATRRCNLSCAYCNEYDQVSQPVPLDTLVQRVDHLASLGTSIITLTGGEPLLHPDLDGVIARIRQHGTIATVITNGYLLTKQRIERLNSAGLDYLQISIDNVDTRRGFDEEPQGLGPKAGPAFRICRVRRQRQRSHWDRGARAGRSP